MGHLCRVSAEMRIAVPVDLWLQNIAQIRIACGGGQGGSHKL